MARHTVTTGLLFLSALTIAIEVEAQSSSGNEKPLAQRDSKLDASLLGAPKDKDKAKDKDKDSDKETAKDSDSAKEETDKKADEDSSKKKDESEGAKKDGKDSSAQVDEADAEFVEPEGESRKWLGLRGRLTLIPQFMFGLFGADGGKTVLSPSVGPELGIRRNGFEYDLWLVYASYSMSDAPFKSSSDPDTAYEIVSSSLKTISIGSDFLWSVPINPRLQLVYGGGAGIGIVFGSLNRTQSYPPNGVTDPAKYLPCQGVGRPNGNYCADDNEHYPGYKEPSWINGGSKPIVFPWIAPFQMGLRWKPAPKVAIRLDVGFAFPGPFFFGLSGQYGIF